METAFLPFFGTISAGLILAIGIPWLRRFLHARRYGPTTASERKALSDAWLNGRISFAAYQREMARPWLEDRLLRDAQEEKVNRLQEL